MHLFFDYDGVFLDSTRIKHDAFLSAAREADDALVEPLSAALRGELVGADRREVAAWVERESGGRGRSASFLAAYSARVEAGLAGLRFTPGVKEILDSFLSNRFRLAVLSKAPESEIREGFARSGIDAGAIFVHLRGFCDKAEALRAILLAEGASACEAVFVGDMPSDYDAARATGVSFIRVRSFGGEMFAWPEGVPTVDSFVQLPEVLPLACHLLDGGRRQDGGDEA